MRGRKSTTGKAVKNRFSDALIHDLGGFLKNKKRFTFSSESDNLLS